MSCCNTFNVTDSPVFNDGQHLDQGRGLEDAVASAIDSLQGTWGLAVIHKDYKDQVVCSRNGSPLLVGCTEGEVFVASEVCETDQKYSTQ